MRWLFLFVLTLNLAYIGWGISNTSVVPYANVPPLKNVPPVVLLSELNTDALAVDKLSSMPAAMDESDDFAAPVTPVVPVVEVANVDTTLVASGESKKNAAVVKIASEQDPAIEPEPVDRCFTLGPFRDLEKLRGFIHDIKAYVATADFRGIEEKELSVYWVYLSPEASHSDAVALGAQLKEKKIKDFFIIRDGEKNHGISLGYFKNKNGAYGLAKRVKNLGFNVEVDPVFKSYINYWLDYQLADGVKVPKLVFDKYIQEGDEVQISQQRRDCVG